MKDFINPLRLRQNDHQFPDGSFKCIFLNENVSILIKFSLKFVPKGPINSIPALVQKMAWHRPGDKPLSEPTSQKMTKSKLQILKIRQNFKFLNFETGITRDTPSEVAW